MDNYGGSYCLNALLMAVPSDAKVRFENTKFESRDKLNALRRELEKTHLVRRKGQIIEVVPYDESHPSDDGKIEEVRLVDRLDLAKALVREWLLKNLRHKLESVDRGYKGSLLYVSRKPNANYFQEAVRTINGINIPEGIGRHKAAEFDVRIISDRSGTRRLAVCIDVKTKIVIDCNCRLLIDHGVDITGCYVQRCFDTELGVHRRLVGRVRDIKADSLLLDDCIEGQECVPICEAFLEPRKESLERVVRSVGGPLADHILDKVRRQVEAQMAGFERLRLIKKFIGMIRNFPTVLAQSANIYPALDAKGRDANESKSALFPNQEKLEKPRLVFDIGMSKTDVWNQRGIEKFGPYNFEKFSPRRLNIAVICQASRQGGVEEFVKKLLDGIPGSKYAERGFARLFRIDQPTISIYSCKSSSPRDYRTSAESIIDDSTSSGTRFDIVMVQIDEAFHALVGDENPYLVTRSILMRHQIPSQSFEWESVKLGGMIDAVVNNIGLAMYAKVGGIPWVLPIQQKITHELVIGLGSFEVTSSRFGQRERYIGVTTVFSADGRYMLESRTPAKPADEYFAELLLILERVISEVRRSQAWDDRHSIRLIFHVFKDFNQFEIRAVKEVTAKLNLRYAEFAFVHLVEDHPFLVFDEAQNGLKAGDNMKGAAVAPRGLLIDLGWREMLVSLKGPNELRRSSDGHPRPLLLRVHPDSTFKDLNYLARQVFDFTCLSWRTFQPTSKPISVLYSDLIAEQLILLQHVKGWAPDVILGPIGRTRWFL